MKQKYAKCRSGEVRGAGEWDNCCDQWEGYTLSRVPYHKLCDIALYKRFTITSKVRK